MKDEYHLDSLEEIEEHELTLSVHQNPLLRQTVIIGQEEFVLKQFSFRWQYWLGPDYYAKGFPKTEDIFPNNDLGILCQDHLGPGFNSLKKI